VPVSRDLWPWPWPWAHPGCTLTWSPSCASLVVIWPLVCEKWLVSTNRLHCYMLHCSVTDLQTNWLHYFAPASGRSNNVVYLCWTITSRRQVAGSPPNLHTMDSRSACIQGVLKVKVKVKGHVIRALLYWHKTNALFVIIFMCTGFIYFVYCLYHSWWIKMTISSHNLLFVSFFPTFLAADALYCNCMLQSGAYCYTNTVCPSVCLSAWNIRSSAKTVRDRPII